MFPVEKRKKLDMAETIENVVTLESFGKDRVLDNPLTEDISSNGDFCWVIRVHRVVLDDLCNLQYRLVLDVVIQFCQLLL